MNAKHQFKYTYTDTDIEEFSPLEVNFEMPGEINLTQMLNNFEQYLRACGFVFNGKLDFVEETYPEYLDEIEQEPGYGCMADFDKECGCSGDSMSHKEYQDQRLKEWNKGLAKLEKDIQEERTIRGKASLRADELKEMNEKWNKLSNDEKANCLNKANKMSGL